MVLGETDSGGYRTHAHTQKQKKQTAYKRHGDLTLSPQQKLGFS